MRVLLLCDRIIEACWLSAIIIAPLFFNYHSSVVFDSDKSILGRSIAVVMLVAFIIKRFAFTKTDNSSHGTIRNLQSIKHPLFIIASLLALSYFVSTLLGVLPSGSWWGSYARGQGTYSLLGYFVIFAITVFTLRDREQIERILITIVLTSIPIVIYGFAQKLKLDPVSWDMDFSMRIASTLGNPIFLGSYLIMVMPIIVYLLLVSHSIYQRLFYLILLLSQFLCLILTQSRGPLLGLIIGMFLFTVLGGLAFRKKVIVWSSFTIVALVIVFFIVLGMPNSPLEGIKPRIGRLGRMFEAREGAAQVRLLIWQGIIKMVKSDYTRAIIGYGPENMFIPYHKYSPTELVISENRIAFPDRAHNEFFDTLITNGISGTFVYLLLFAAIIFYTFKHLFLIKTTKDVVVITFLLVVFTLAGAGIPILLNKTIFLAIGIPIGLITGAVVYLFFVLLSSRTFSASSSPLSRLFVISLFSAIIGHFVESQFGIALTAARVYFWFYLAVLFVYIKGIINDKVESDANILFLIPIITLFLSICAFNFITHQVFAENINQITRAVIMIIICWCVFSVFLYISYRSFLIAVIPAGATILFIIVLLSFLPPLQIPTKTITFFYIWIMANIILAAYLLKEKIQIKGRAQPSPTSTFTFAPSLALILILIVVLWYTDIQVIHSAIIYKIGSSQEKDKQWEIALKYYEQATQLSRDKGNYYGASARMCLEKYYREAEPDRKKFWADKCLGLLLKSVDYDALNPVRNVNLARFYRVLARESPDPEKREALFLLANKYYEIACRLSPNHPSLRNEWGEVYHEMGRLDQAIRHYELSSQIAEGFSETYSHLGDAYLEKRDIPNALKYYRQAAQIHWKSFADLRDPNQEAIFLRTNQTLNKHEPDNYIPYYNFAQFYLMKRQLKQAREMAEKSLSLAPKEEQRPINDLIEKIVESRK
jgi:O-antigen ligase/tetratricopeptide (TPR) repeat protein